MKSKHRVLITGASGFVGRWMARALRDVAGDEEIEIIAAARERTFDVHFDVTDYAAVTRTIKEIRPTAIIHLAAVAAPVEARLDPALAWEANLTGTVNLARATLDEAPDCRFVFAGSAEAYGQSFAQADGRPLDESVLLQPMTVYGATKAAADIAVGQMFFEGLRSIRFRPFNHTGPGQSDAFVLPAFASQIARIEKGLCKPVIEVGNLDACRDFLDVRDVVQAYALAACGRYFGAEGSAFNLASGKPTRVGALLDALVALSDQKIEVVVSPHRVRSVEIPIACGSSTRAREMFGWRPKFSIQETVSSVLEDWRSRS